MVKAFTNGRQLDVIQNSIRMVQRCDVTENPRYNNNVCYQRFCCKLEFAIIKKLDKDP